MEHAPIKMGVIAELTGPLSFMGIADANVCKMLVEDINEAGGLLGRPTELIIEDGETDDATAKTAAAKLVDEDKVDLVVGEEYFPLDHADYRDTVEKIMSSGTEVVFNTIVPPGLTPFLEELHNAGFIANGGKIICTYFDKNFLNLVPAEHVEGLYSCLDYYQGIDDPFSQELLKDYNRRFPGSAMFTAGSGCSGHYKAIKLWEAAVKEAGTLDQEAVIGALDHARIEQAPGGPAEVVPGQRHLRHNMYIAQARNGKFEVVENLGMIDPKERSVRTRPEPSAVS